jgi:FkbM family methyltransferase
MNKEQNHFLSNIFRGIRYRIGKSISDKNRKAGLNWFRIKKLKHLPYNSPHTYNLSGSKIEFNNGPELLHSLQEIFVDDIYKIHFNTSSPYIIDCGANIGLSVIYLKTQYPQARIIAFEPDPVNFKFLEKNIRSSKFTDVELRNEAIWKDNSTLEFVSDGTLGSKLVADADNSNIIKVKATRLKDLLDQKVDFLKMDIEGAEYEVLKDCGKSLKNIDHLFIEFHGFFTKMYELTDILQLVQSNGFSYYIKEASNVYPTPFERQGQQRPYDIQQNIFCFRINR